VEQLEAGFLKSFVPMPDPTERLNAVLRGRYSIERELGEGGMASAYRLA